MTFLADLATSPTPETIWIGMAFLTLAAIAKGINEVLRLVDRAKTKPPASEQVQKLEEWIEKNFATKADLQHAKELFASSLLNQDGRIARLDELIRSNEAKHEQRAVALHDRINPLLEALGAMKNEIRRREQHE